MARSNSEQLTIKAVAEHLGTTAKTVKKLEAQGIFPQAERNLWGHRTYTPQMLPDLERRFNKYREQIVNVAPRKA